MVDRNLGTGLLLLQLLNGACATGGPCDARDAGDVREIRIAWEEALRFVDGTTAGRERIAVQLGDAIDALARLERAKRIGAEAAELIRSRLRTEHHLLNPPPGYREWREAVPRELGPEEMGRRLPLLERFAAEGTIPPTLLCPLIAELERGLGNLDEADPRPAGLLAHNRRVFRLRLARLKRGPVPMARDPR